MVKQQHPLNKTKVFCADEKYIPFRRAIISTFYGYESSPRAYPYYTESNFYKYILICGSIVEETV